MVEGRRGGGRKVKVGRGGNGKRKEVDKIENR
jgi:hypothetical protein